MADVTTTFAAKDESFATTVANLQQSLSTFGSNVQTFNTEFAEVGRAFTTVAQKGAALVLGFVGVNSAFDALKTSFNKAAEFQELERRFEVLLGSSQAAKDRLAELSEFMDTTPFELTNIVQANVALQNLTQGALATEAGMRQIGDAASALGVPIDQMAQIVGRLYSALQAGAPIGQFTGRLLELGAITPETKRQLEELDNTLDGGAAAWNMVTQELNRFSGAMRAESTTWNATMSGFKDAIDSAMRSFAAPLLPPLTAAVQQLADLVRNDLAPGIERAMGAFTTDWLPGILNAFTDIRAAGGAFNQLMITGAMELGNAIVDNLSLAFRSVGLGFENVMQEAINSLGAIISNTWQSALDAVIVAFLQGLQGALNLVSGIIPGAEAAAQRIAQEIDAATSRIEAQMGSAALHGQKVLDAFTEGASQAEFIEHRVFDSSTSADKVAQYLEQAKERGAIPTEQAYAAIANRHAPEIARLMEQVELSSQASQSAFAEVQLNLQAAETSAQNISIAFGSADNSGSNLFSNLNSAEASAKGVDGWIGSAGTSSNKISIAGAKFETSAANAAGQITTAKGDAHIIANILSGPQGLTEKFNEAMARTRELRDVIDRFIAAGREVAENLARASRMDQNARQYERNEDRAHNLRERGYDKTANQIERNAKQKFERDTIKERTRQNAEDARARAYERAEDADSLREALDIKRKADNEYRDTMEELNQMTKEQLNDLANGLSEASDDIRSGGKEASDSLKEAAAAVKAAFSESEKQRQLALETTLIQCRGLLAAINEKLPQHALSP
jgi:uncharacterized protein YjiS (DUF1127 family)